MNNETEAPVDTPPAPPHDSKAETHAAPTDVHPAAHEHHASAEPEPVHEAAHAGAASAAPEPAVPEVEASVEQETVPEPESAPPPEIAEVAAETALHEQHAGAAHEPEPSELGEVAAEVAHLNEHAAGLEHESAAYIADDASPESSQAAVEPAPVPTAPTDAAEPEPAAAPVKPKRTRAKSAKTAAVAEEPEAPQAEPTDTVTPTEAPAAPPVETKKKWYAVKVQSGREDTIKAAILRKVAIEGLEEFFGQILIPVEEVIEKKQVRVKNKKTGEYEHQEKKVTKKRKKFHGYIFANVEFNDRILYLFRETSGVGDFLNVRGTPGNPIAEPMPEHEVQAMLTGVSVKPGGKGGKVKVKLDFEKGDRVRVREGSFANQEGEVKEIQEPKDPTDSVKIKVVLTFWGRPLEVDLDHWQVEKV
jgi:transcriptional antiterminator NusG